MPAHKSQIGWIAAGLLIIGTSGCQSPQQGASAELNRQRLSGFPSDLAEPREAVSPKILPETHVAAGRLHESQGKLGRAAEQYRLAIAAQPNHVEAHNRLGIVLDGLGKFDEADRAFARAIRLAPGRADLRNNLAFSYIMQRRWPEAQVELNKALELQPDFARARVNLAMVMAQQDLFEEAFENFNRVLRPEDAWYNMGLMYQSRKRPVEAAQAFKQALQANPKLTAAQKRLELLPPEAVQEAEGKGPLFAPALAENPESDLEDFQADLPVDLASVQSVATRPEDASDLPIPSDAGETATSDLEDFQTDLPVDLASVQSVATRPEDASDLPIPSDAAETATVEMESPTTRPADTNPADDDYPFAERMDADAWLFSDLTPGGTADLWPQDTGWIDFVAMIREAAGPVEQFLCRLQAVQEYFEGEEASPPPLEVPAAEEEEPPVYDLSVSRGPIR